MLFRSEAVRHKTKTFGNILLVRPISSALLVGLCCAIVLCIAIFLCLFTYAKKIEVSGIVLPETGLTYIVARQSGVVSKSVVTEGKRVESGDLLVVIENKNATSTERDLEGKILSLLRTRQGTYGVERDQVAQQAIENSKALKLKIEGQLASLARIDEHLALQSRQTRLSEAILDNFKRYEPGDYVAKLEVQQREAVMLEQQMRLSELKRSRLVAKQELEASQLELHSSSTQTKLTEQGIVREMSSIGQQLVESEARREIHAVAPHSGIASAISVVQGQAVSAGQPLMAIVPENSLMIVELYAPSRAIGLIWPGKEVQLRYQAFPYQRYGFAGGSILEVARTAMRPEEISPLYQGAAFSGQAEPVYKIRVRLDKQSMQADGNEWPLRAGSLVDASVLIERRPLIMWMLDPVFARTKKL